MTILWTLVLGGMLTFAMRFSFIYLHGRIAMPTAFSRALRFVPGAVFSAIVVPELLLHSGSLYLSLENAMLVAGALAVVVAWRTKSAILTIVAGLGLLAALESLS